METFEMTKEFTVYNYCELSEDAKNRVKMEYLKLDRTPEDFQYMLKENLDDKFERSPLSVNFDFSCCQGSGLNIEGSLEFSDILQIEEICNKFTEKENRALYFYFEGCQIEPYEFYENARYSYSCKYADRPYLASHIMYELEENHISNINTDLVERVSNAILDYMEDMEKYFYEWGMEYFYEISDEDMEEICNMYGFKYLEDGKTWLRR